MRLAHTGERMAQASTRPVSEKLLLKPHMRAVVLHAPAGYVERLPSSVSVSSHLDAGMMFDFVQVFVTSRDALLRDGPRWRQALEPNGLFWLSYPKGKSIATDLNRDVVRTTLQEVGLEVVSQVAIDDVWSALRAKPR